MQIKDKIENNPVIWTLSTLLIGFLSGFGVYQSILAVAGRKTVPEDAVIVKSGEQPISSEEYARLKESQGKIDKLRLKQQYLTHCIRFYETRGQDHVFASEMFVLFLSKLWEHGKQDMTKNGYEIHKSNADLQDSYITFEDDPAFPYKIPRDVKGEVLKFGK